MIGRLTGILLEKQPPQVLLDVAGVGYEVDVPMSSFYNLPASGERVSLFTHFVVREDAQQLFGFLTHKEREAFRALIRISGVGPKLALAVLSGLSVDDLAQCVVMQDAGRLTRVPGIGKKTAERLIVEMRDRLGRLDDEAFAAAARPQAAGGAAPSAVEDAVSALVALGYKPPEASRMVRAVAADGLASEDLIRAALKAAAPQG